MCFSFWYHISGEGTLTSLDLKVTLVRDKEKDPLLNIPEKETDGWKNAKVLIGNQPAGYKVKIFLFKPFYIDTFYW